MALSIRKMSRNGAVYISMARVVFLLCLVVASPCFALRSSSSVSISNDDNAARASSSSSEVFHSKREYLRQAASSIPSAAGISVPWWGTLASVTEELESCEEVYGFFPCSTTFGGNLFLLIVYGFLLLKAAQFLSSGSELLLTVLNPGLIGGLLLPILGALPDALLIMVSGLSASAADAQSEVLVGMGLLAGSNIMLLTALWGGCLLVGRCDLVPQRHGALVAKDKTLTHPWSLKGTGVTTDQQTRVASWIMVVTVLPYLVAQTPVVFGWSEGSTFVLAGCIISVIGLASYCTYQVVFPWIQQRWTYRAKEKVRRSFALHKFSQFSADQKWGNLLLSDGVTPNTEVLLRIHKHFDKNSDNVLSEAEMKGLIIGLGIQNDGKIPDEDEVKQWFAEFDFSNDRKLSEDEFVEGMSRWVRSFVQHSKAPKRSTTRTGRGGVADGNSDSISEAGPHIFWRNHLDRAQSSLSTLLEDQVNDDDEEEREEAPPTKSQVIATAIGFLVLGTLVAGAVADPLVDAIGNFSSVTGISPFFISFVATPLATNSSEAISSLMFARRKKKNNISMTYSQIYGGVTMNNTLCLAIFLAIVYIRGLIWDFSSEVLVILVATVVIGALASVRVTFPSWMAIVALILYPFSIALVAVLDYVYGWQ
ncbi:unnamed protein product [Calypogeia fissa]